MIKVLITGINGFIGRNLADALHQEGIYKIDGLGRSNYCDIKIKKYYSIDISNFDELKKVENHYDIIFHCAGNANVPQSVRNPYLDFKSNMLGTFNMLEFARLTKSSTFIFLSSVSVFDNKNKLPLTEKSLKIPSSPYGASKNSSENFCIAFHKTFKMDIRVARIFNTYGPGCKNLFIHDFIGKIKGSSSKIILMGSGDQTRDYVYISDLVDGIILIASSGKYGEDYNICSGTPIKIRDIAHMILDELNITDKKVIFDKKKYPGDIEHWYGDNSKIASLGFKQSITFRDGMKKIILNLEG